MTPYFSRSQKNAREICLKPGQSNFEDILHNGSSVALIFMLNHQVELVA